MKKLQYGRQFYKEVKIQGKIEMFEKKKLNESNKKHIEAKHGGARL